MVCLLNGNLKIDLFAKGGQKSSGHYGSSIPCITARRPGKGLRESRTLRFCSETNCPVCWTKMIGQDVMQKSCAVGNAVCLQWFFKGGSYEKLWKVSRWRGYSRSFPAAYAAGYTAPHLMMAGWLPAETPFGVVGNQQEEPGWAIACPTRLHNAGI